MTTEDDTAPDALSATAAEASSTGAHEKTGDPVARALTLALLGVVIVFLVAVASALVFGFLRPAKAPRTLSERNLATYGAEVASGQADAETWGKYIGVLIDTGQFAKAREALEAALESATGGRSYILLQQARLEYESGEYAASVQTCDAAIAAAQEELDARLAELKANGITTAKPEVERPESWSAAAHLKGDSLTELEDWPGAIAAYDAYLTILPGDADILVARGRIKIMTGDAPGAEKDFREALRFIPDHAPALDELQQMGAETP